MYPILVQQEGVICVGGKVNFPTVEREYNTSSRIHVFAGLIFYSTWGGGIPKEIVQHEENVTNRSISHSFPKL